MKLLKLMYQFAIIEYDPCFLAAELRTQPGLTWRKFQVFMFFAVLMRLFFMGFVAFGFAMWFDVFVRLTG